jgi:hypothetical protein
MVFGKLDQLVSGYSSGKVKNVYRELALLAAFNLTNKNFHQTNISIKYRAHAQ